MKKIFGNNQHFFPFTSNNFYLHRRVGPGTVPVEKQQLLLAWEVLDLNGEEMLVIHKDFFMF